MANYIVGLTGGIGSGKTTVANFFAELGIDVVDADVVAREVVAPQSYGLNAIKQYFGEDFILADGNLDRQKLRTQIFSEPNDKTWLNNLLHPLIRQEMLAQLDACQSPYCILVAPLLLENNLDKLVNSVLVIDVDKQTQIERVLKRDTSNASEIKNIIASQIDRKQRLAKADNIINNQNSDLSLVRQQVSLLHLSYLEQAKTLKHSLNTDLNN